jgi:hypothetical protein
MSTYKSFTLNAPSDPAPWGTVENQAWKDCIDTLCVGTVAAAKDVTYGHKHKELCYNDPAVPVMLAVDSSIVEIYSNTERPSKVRFCASHADQSNNGIICDTAGLLTVNNDSGALALTSGTVGGVAITNNCGAANVVITSAADIVLTPTVEIYSNTERPSKVRFCASHADRSNNGIICDTAGLLTVNNDSGALALTSGTVGGVAITNNCGAANVVITSAADIVLTPTSSTGRITITSLPTSSAGLTSGMLWNSGGAVKII